MSFMDILKKDDNESKFEKKIRLFKEILDEDSLDEEKEKLLKTLYKDLNNYFLRGGILPNSFKELIEADRDKNEKKLYLLFKQIGIKQNNKYATKNPNREAFNSYINFKYDSRLTELKPIIRRLKTSDSTTLLDVITESELSSLFDSKNKILALELISRIAILEDDIKEDTKLRGGKMLSDVKDTLESNFEIIVYLYNVLEVMARVRSESKRGRISNRTVLLLQKDLDYISTRGVFLDSSLSLPEEKMELLTKLYRKKIENPTSSKRTQSPSGEGRLVPDKSAEQRAKDFKENAEKELEGINFEIKNLTENEKKFSIYVNLRNKISDNIVSDVKEKDVKRIFEQDVEMDEYENKIEDDTKKFKEELVTFMNKKSKLTEEEGLSDTVQDENLKFFEDRETKNEEIENLMQSYFKLVEKNILPYKLRLGSDKGEYSQRTKSKETKRGQELSDKEGKIPRISQDIKELEEVGRDWLANYGLSQTKLKLPRNPFGERIDAKKYKKILRETPPEDKKVSDPKDLPSYVPRDEYMEEDTEDTLGGRKEKYKTNSKITPERARYLYGGKPPPKKKKDEK